MLRCEVSRWDGHWPSFKFFDDDLSLPELYELVVGMPLEGGPVPRDLKEMLVAASRIGESWVSIAFNGPDEDRKILVEHLLRAGVSVRLVKDD